MKAWRIGLTIGGILVALYGAVRLLTGVPVHSLVLLALWLIVAVLIHDGVLSSLVVAVGWAVSHLPPRGRRYLQAGLIMAAMVTVVAVPMISQQFRQPPVKALLQQDFRLNLTVLLVIIAVGTLAAYAVRVARDRATRRRSSPSVSSWWPSTGYAAPSRPPRCSSCWR